MTFTDFISNQNKHTSLNEMNLTCMIDILLFFSSYWVNFLVSFLYKNYQEIMSFLVGFDRRR